jgi:hypothetical protein
VSGVSGGGLVGEEVHDPIPVDILFGTASYLVKPSFFNLTVLLQYDVADVVADSPRRPRSGGC